MGNGTKKTESKKTEPKSVPQIIKETKVQQKKQKDFSKKARWVAGRLEAAEKRYARTIKVLSSTKSDAATEISAKLTSIMQSITGLRSQIKKEYGLD